VNLNHPETGPELGHHRQLPTLDPGQLLARSFEADGERGVLRAFDQRRPGTEFARSLAAPFTSLPMPRRNPPTDLSDCSEVSSLNALPAWLWGVTQVDHGQPGRRHHEERFADSRDRPEGKLPGGTGVLATVRACLGNRGRVLGHSKHGRNRRGNRRVAGTVRPRSGHHPESRQDQLIETTRYSGIDLTLAASQCSCRRQRTLTAEVVWLPGLRREAPGFEPRSSVRAMPQSG
jgi:hypothetical protein